MKSCELCKSPARVYCDSDQANLCWSCDCMVHSANFLVARHSRSLLCRVCRSPTPWTASGEKLLPSAASICEKCVVDGTYDDGEDSQRESHNDNDDVDNDEYDGDEDGETELDIDVDDEEDGDDNQVVPLSYPPPPAASTSSDDESIGDLRFIVKRKRESVADLSEDEGDDDDGETDVDVNSSEAINGSVTGT